MDKNSLKIFISFLKENNAYERYKANLINAIGYYDAENWLKYVEIDKVITHAFFWGNTKEGFNFWRGVNREWDTCSRLCGLLNR